MLLIKSLVKKSKRLMKIQIILQARKANSFKIKTLKWQVKSLSRSLEACRKIMSINRDINKPCGFILTRHILTRQIGALLFSHNNRKVCVQTISNRNTKVEDKEVNKKLNRYNTHISRI